MGYRRIIIKRTIYRLLTFAYLLLMISLSSSGVCEEDNTGIKTQTETIVVTSQKTEDDFQTGDVDKAQVPSFFTVINRDEFEGKLETLADVIEKEAGIQIRQTGGLGSASTISLRGSTSEQVMVYLDGILLNDASGGGVDFSNISLSDIATIEVYKGGAPVHLGKTSIGGVVNIRTVRKKQGLNGSIHMGYGSYDTIKIGAFINHKPDDWDYIVSADYLASENNFDVLNNNGTQWNLTDDQWEKRNNADIDQTNLLVKLGYDISGRTRVDLANQYFLKKQGLPSRSNPQNNQARLKTFRNLSTIQLTADNVTPFGFNTRTRIDYGQKLETYADLQGYIGLDKQHSKYRTHRIGANFFIEWLSDIQTISGSLDVQQETFVPEDVLKGNIENESRRRHYSIGIQDAIFLFNEKWVLTPAVRYSIVQDELEKKGELIDKSFQDQQQDDDYFQPQFGTKFKVFTWLTLKSNIAKYVREPSFFELFGDRGHFIGNDELLAEEGVNVDAGFEIHHRFALEWLNQISAQGAYFKSDVKNLITRVYDARGIGKSDNISDSLIQGVETSFLIDGFNHFRISGNVTMQDTENKNEKKHFDHKKLPGRFERSYLAKLESFFGDFEAYIEYVLETGMYYDTANLLPAENKSELNAGFSYRFNNGDVEENWLFRFDAKNLNDDLYEDFKGYPQPGRSFFATIKYRF